MKRVLSTRACDDTVVLGHRSRRRAFITRATAGADLLFRYIHAPPRALDLVNGVCDVIQKKKKLRRLASFKVFVPKIQSLWKALIEQDLPLP